VRPPFRYKPWHVRGSGSINSRGGGPLTATYSATYSATKAAMELLTASLARDLGPRGVRVVGVAPGQTDTAMVRRVNPPERLRAGVERTPLGRLGQPAEIAEAVAFLASDEARWITRETIHVNGGQRPS
jgi:3-oxoacyl-[acyl-carrier protein] reductase